MTITFYQLTFTEQPMSSAEAVEGVKVEAVEGVKVEEAAVNVEAAVHVLVRGFDYGTTEEALRGHFGTFGEITKAKVYGSSGVVTFVSFEAAAAAAKALHGSIIPGNTRYIDTQETDQVPNKVIVKGFDFGTEEKVVRAHCATVGDILSFNFVGSRGGTAVLEYESEDQVIKAIETLSKTTIEGNTRYIEVKLDMPRFKSRNKRRRESETVSALASSEGNMVSKLYELFTAKRVNRHEWAVTEVPPEAGQLAQFKAQVTVVLASGKELEYNSDPQPSKKKAKLSTATEAFAALVALESEVDSPAAAAVAVVPDTEVKQE